MLNQKLSVGLKLGFLTSLILGLGFSSVYFLFDTHKTEDLDALMLKQARILSQQIIDMRQWNADHGGVYVLKRPGVETNKYLYKVGPGKIEPDITDTQGRTYTLKNPAQMSRELSEIMKKRGLISYRLTSLQYLNPANAPDAFETVVLKQFKTAPSEFTEILHEGDKTLYRYMTPLRTKKSCLECHGNQGYKIGDVRGALSISIPMDTEVRVINTERRLLLLSSVSILLTVILLLILISWSLITRPIGLLRNFASSHMGKKRKLESHITKRQDEVGELARSLQASSIEIRKYRKNLETLVSDRTKELENAKTELDKISRTDPLTGINNRRHMEMEAPRLLSLTNRQDKPTAFLVLDIDYFKKVNDTYGHDIGDLALIHMANILEKTTRPYDLLIRYGGEEFVIILPGHSVKDGTETAERIRMEVEKTPVKWDAQEINLTISIGVFAGKDISNADDAIAQADKALYKAKEGGRNRVCS